ncbi:MAG: Gfo/Idh/MocA family oxidoreductase [Clostridia bacterium]|nr:Gfo/Idh/MocA family oxidoreductase [Clostridia bacterium]
MKTISVIGLGNRGTEYMMFVKMFCKNVKIVALCDTSEQALTDIAPRYKIPRDKCFSSTNDFFAQGKISDAVFICTQDKTHYEIGRRAIEIGYHILMEKPVSDNLTECIELMDLSKQHNVNMVVCHVLRYSNYYQKIKNCIRDGILGDIVNINHIENVGYFHFAHSYVRGNWKSEKTATPSLMAKCCHDLDLIQWFMGSECTSVSSYGELSIFKKQNAPANAAERCVDCKVEKCPYNAVNLYLKDPFWKAKFVKYMRRTLTGKTGASKADVLEALKNGDYGKCVYHSENDVCDHQIVAMQFANGATATHTLNAFSNKMMRESRIVGTKGELIATDKKLVLNIFGGRKRTLIAGSLITGHIEGDYRTVIAFCKLLNGKLDESLMQDVTFISDTIASHQIVMAAEKSRHNGGIPVDPQKII